MACIYLDYNATTPLDPVVLKTMYPFLAEHFGNPSSSHIYGRRTNAAVKSARGEIASLIGAAAKEIIFTSGGSESNNLAIKGAALQARGAGRGAHIITSAIEHPAVSEVCAHLGSLGFEITTLAVDRQGLISVADVRAALRKDTILISIMHANNEIGTIQPIGDISDAVKSFNRSIIVHTDAAQSVSKIPLEVDELGVDLLTLVGHKIYAPKGIGALYIRDGVKLVQQIHGAGHEGGFRAGTENVPYIVALGCACRLAAERFPESSRHMLKMRRRLSQQLTGNISGHLINGHPEYHLPNTLNISFSGIQANMLIDRVKDDLAISAGAACHAGDVHLSATLAAICIPPEFAGGTIRISSGQPTTAEEVDRAAAIIIKAVHSLRS